MRIPTARAVAVIQKGELRPGYILFGTDLYWRDRIWTALREAVSGNHPGGMNVSEWDLRRDSVEAVLDGARALSLLASRQLLLVRNAQLLVSSSRRRTASRTDEDEADDRTGKGDSGSLESYFQRPNPASTLVLEMMDMDLQSEDWREKEKAKSRLERLEGLCDVVLLLRPEAGETAAIVRQEAERRGCGISPEAAAQLAAIHGCDLGRICQELEKLCLYNAGKDRIELGDLEAGAKGEGIEAAVSLAEAIGAGDREKALEILDAMLQEGRYLPLVVSELARHFRQLIVLKEAKVQNPRQAAKILWEAKVGVPPNLVPALVNASRRYSGSALLEGLRLAFEADLALRSSPADPRIVFERFILSLASLSRTNAAAVRGR